MPKERSELRPENRRELRRLVRKHRGVTHELRSFVVYLVDVAHEPQAAIAREMGVERANLWAKLKSWKTSTQSEPGDA